MVFNPLVGGPPTKLIFVKKPGKFSALCMADHVNEFKNEKTANVFVRISTLGSIDLKYKSLYTTDFEE